MLFRYCCSKEAVSTTLYWLQDGGDLHSFAQRTHVAEVLTAFNNCVGGLVNVRRLHMKMVADYILKQKARVHGAQHDGATRGTGGQADECYQIKSAIHSALVAFCQLILLQDTFDLRASISTDLYYVQCCCNHVHMSKECKFAYTPGLLGKDEPFASDCCL